ncbi:hypothetical protein GCM10011321_29210 [Youhaiella tibetensis]|nr:hypothetical protein GCM10011321_29210 [Youhaiella tibetensis]
MTLLIIDSENHISDERSHEYGDLTIAALSRVSLLSIPVALENLVPILEAAADGDPTTVVPDARR